VGIDIYARWRGQSRAEIRGQAKAWLCPSEGAVGYLREAYHGEPYATKYLCAEAFQPDGAKIEAAVLRKRLPHTLALAEERERTLYQSDAKAIEAAKQSYRDFVSLCERKEKETGEPVLIIASY
jgi:hypothetical protein